MRMLAARLLALSAGLACLAALRQYPLGHGWPVWLLYALLPCYFLLLCWRPALWLFVLPALLPVLDLAPWTGWFFFEEIDLLLLLTVACGYARWQPSAMRLGLSPGARLWLALATIAALAAMLRGWLWAPLPGDNLNAWNNYLSPYNSLRLGKAWCWAMLLLPLLRRDGASDGLRRLALPGVLSGLGLVALCALWERAVFPGVFNMASDYRITAPFSAMHTGGAALDGYLALALPFAGLWLARAHTRLMATAALLLLGLALHAALATFSRALYAAIPVAAVAGLACWQLAQGRQGRKKWSTRRVVAGLLLGAGAAALLALMFHAAGYRGLLAATVLLAGAFVLATQALPWRLAPACLLCALALQATLAALWPHQLGHGLLKAPYALFLLSSLLLAFSLWRRWLPLAMMALTMMACNTAWIGWHWAGAVALRPAALVLLLAALLLLNSRLRLPLWRMGRASVSMAAAAALMLMLAIPVSASYYANERFATTAGDWQGRLRHWRQALAMMPADWTTTAFGMGTGTFPGSYFWRNTLGDVPARLAYADEAGAGNRYLRLSSPGYRAGYGELLRLLQRVSVQPDTRYALALDVRRHGPMPVLQLKLCQRQLLYAQYCVHAPLRLLPANMAAPHWQHYQLFIDSARLGDGAWLLRAPVQLELAASGLADPSFIDVDNLSLRAPDGEELLANGSFSKANNYWFFSSDHHHLPWHIKNLWLHLYVESGVSGLLSMLGLCVLACANLVRRAAQGPGAHGAAAMLAALAGFMVIGVFDSLLDVPRIALLFYMLLLCALLQPSPPLVPERSPR
ncbi:hypothetical protein [Janthinobacterium psychrotolerans]|uniref:O-Antigen ligase n=1 Tax=Janthinobacterium psychrotolerans TaxID=1747903 RepID=A0A1A7BYD5_9BURK|nr:hypothetical protein [Janthinobacterium psychrotolerans]OBV37749.1 hypothetical protein ASR47_100421 [Janthinobacterium psychrotolerans]